MKNVTTRVNGLGRKARGEAGRMKGLGMASNWIKTTIGEQTTLQRGFDITKAAQREGVVPVISSGGISSYHDTAPVKGPGVVLGRKGVVGSVYYVVSDYWPHDTTLWVKDFHGNDPRFAYYFFKEMAPRLAQMDVGSANPTLNRNHVHPIQVLWPPLPEQKAIAHILGTLDDKIELNRKMNETLEAMARAIFKSWFVDFDPVHEKRGARRGGLETRPYMTPEILSLFPDSFEDSELGRIPKGWRVGVVANLAMLGRNSVNPLDFPGETFDHYSIPAFDEGRRPKTEVGAEIKSNKFIVPLDAVLLSKLNPRIPRVWLPDLPGTNRAVCSTEYLVSVPVAGVSREYLFGLFSNSEFISNFATLVTGTSGSHQRVKPESLLNLPVVIPPEALINAYTNTVKPILLQVTHNIKQSHTLAAIRNALLPKLLAGEMKIEDEERFMEAHV